MIPENPRTVVAQVRAQATPAACRRFAIMLLAGLPIAGFVWLVLLRITAGGWFWSVQLGFALAALVLGGSALAAPGWSRSLYIGWHTVARVVELAVTWLLLACVFWLVITPVGLVRRRKVGTFHRRPGPGAKSYWQEVPPVKDPSRYYRQF